MKIKQIGNYNGDIIETIIENRNIENVDLFLNPDNSDDSDPFNLTNIEEGVKVFLSHILINNNVSILVDPDADGFTSSSIIYQYIKKINPEIKIEYFLHEDKSHGLTEKIMEDIAKSKTDFLIIPDASSNDNDNINKLYVMGIEVLILDHHIVESIPDQGILINNQLDSNKKMNKNLTGAGVVYKFCQALDKVLNKNYSDNFLDLVAIGQVGDASDISENEVRNLVFSGLKNIKNNFVKTVLSDCFEDIDKIVPKDLSFSIIPMINSVTRVGTKEEKEYLFKSLNNIDSYKIFVVKKRKKNKETGKFDSFEIDQNIYEYTYDICKRTRGRQGSLVKKIMTQLDKDIDASGKISIGILESSEFSTITGLVANKISDKYQKPALLLYPVEEDGIKRYVGSGRGNEKVLSSLRDWCKETNLVEFARGHDNAFGISILEKNFEGFKEKTKKIKKEKTLYMVDLHFRGEHNINDVLKVHDHKFLFGGKVHDPLFAFTELPIEKRFIRKRGSMLTLFDKGLEFVMFGAPDGLYEDLVNNFEEYLILDLVGQPGVNSWSERIQPQIILKDLRMSDKNKAPKDITVDTIIF